jgi:hypothetical protein
LSSFRVSFRATHHSRQLMLHRRLFLFEQKGQKGPKEQKEQKGRQRLIERMNQTARK